MKGRRVAIGAVLAGGLLAASGLAAQEGVAVKSLLGAVGIIPGDREAIDYRERAPLVLPPRMELREPVSSADAAPARAAQWPNDPDVLAAKRKQAEDLVPVTESPLRRANDGDRLSLQELQAGQRRPSAYSRPQPAKGEKENGAPLSPDALRAQRSAAADTAVASGDEPARGRLAQPPTGFRKPAPGAPVKADSEPVVREDEADPRNFQRQQARR